MISSFLPNLSADLDTRREFLQCLIISFGHPAAGDERV